MTRTRVKVDFAGTPKEVKAFVKAYSGKFPNGLTSGRGGAERTPNGDQMLVARFKDAEELMQVERAFISLGWDIGSQG